MYDSFLVTKDNQHEIRSRIEDFISTQDTYYVKVNYPKRKDQKMFKKMALKISANGDFVLYADKKIMSRRLINITKMRKCIILENQKYLCISGLKKIMIIAKA